MFAGRSESNATNISSGNGIEDQFNTKYKTDSTTQQQWLKPTSTTGQNFNAGKMETLHVNYFNFDVPNFPEVKDKSSSSSGWNNITAQFVITLGTT